MGTGGLLAFDICQFTPIAPTEVVDQPSQICPSTGGVDTDSLWPVAAREGSFQGSPEMTMASEVVAPAGADMASSEAITVRNRIAIVRRRWLSLVTMG